MPGLAAEVSCLQQLVDGDEVAEALRHLGALDLQMAVMHPDVGHDPCAEGAGRLRHLILVMGKDEVDAAAMDVEGFAEQCRRHGRAFEMPARAPEAPGAVPAGLAAAAWLPQHEIHRVALIGCDL